MDDVFSCDNTVCILRIFSEYRMINECCVIHAPWLSVVVFDDAQFYHVLLQ